MKKSNTAQTSQERPALIVATLASFMGPFLISAVNVALHAIQREIYLSAFKLSWIATAYLLAVAVGLVAAGKIGDIHDRKKVFAAGPVVSCLGSALAVLVTTPAALIGVRFLQGLGASMCVPAEQIAKKSNHYYRYPWPLSKKTPAPGLVSYTPNCKHIFF